jgi:subtilisin family serine protease
MTRDLRHSPRATPRNPQYVPGPLSRGARIILVAFLTLGLAAGPVPGQDGDGSSARHGKARLAPDLVAALENGAADRSDRMVRLVANLDVSDSRTLSEDLGRLGGSVRAEYKSVKQAVLEVPLSAVAALTDVAGLDYVAPDRPVFGQASHIQTTTGASQVYPLENWQPLSSFLVTGGLKGYDGSGVGVAVIDSGIDGEHADLRDNGKRRMILTVDFVNEGSSDDPYGHGTHVAGVVAGNGSASRQAGYDYSGIAPKANLLNLRVLDKYGRGYTSNVVAAIDFAIANRAPYNIRVLNLSLAAPPVESYRDDPLCQAVERAVRSGLVVVASAGNFGMDPYGQKVYGGITSPGISPAAITVGALHTRGTDRRSDDVIALYSSRGPTRSRSIDPATGEVMYDNLAKPDLVAPGMRIVSLERYENSLVTWFPFLHVNTGSGNTRNRYMVLSGTSMSAAAVSGAAALILQANPSLTPNMVKAILMHSAQIMNGPDLFEQGTGSLNVEGALRIARALRKDADSLQVGQKLVLLGLPRAESTIAGETVLWGQSLIWGSGLVTGSATLTQQQEAYAQSLIWGSRLAWGAGVTFSDGLYSDRHVVFGQGNQWRYVTWDSGTPLDSGLVYRDDLAASGVEWSASQISDAFFTIDPATLIWGYSRYAWDLSLIWTFEQSLIWGYGLHDQSLIWGAL